MVEVNADQDASELGPVATTFTITRSANFSDALTVNFSLTGTSSAADYTVSNASSFAGGSGTVDFAAEQTTAQVVVTPVIDNISEGIETLIFSIESGTGYNFDRFCVRRIIRC